MRWLITAQVILLSLAMQVAWVQRVEIFDATPDILLILIVQFAFTLPPAQAFVASWCTGLVFDLRVAEPTGMWAMIYGLIAIAIAKARRSDDFAPLPVRLSAVMGAAVMAHIGEIILKAFRGHPLGWLHVKRLFLDSIYATIAAIVFLPLFALVLRKLHSQQRWD